MRARSSSNVVSVSSKRLGSWPASRATEFLAMSQPICTWRVSGNMSGARRAASSTAGSIFFSVAKASPFSSTCERLLSALARTSVDIAYMVTFMLVPSVVGLGGCRGGRRRAGRTGAAYIRSGFALDPGAKANRCQARQAGQPLRHGYVPGAGRRGRAALGPLDGVVVARAVEGDNQRHLAVRPIRVGDAAAGEERAIG